MTSMQGCFSPKLIPKRHMLAGPLENEPSCPTMNKYQKRLVFSHLNGSLIDLMELICS